MGIRAAVGCDRRKEAIGGSDYIDDWAGVSPARRP